MDTEELKRLQHEYAQQVSLNNAFTGLNQIRTIAAADISFNRSSPIGYAAVVLFSYPDLTRIDQASTTMPLEIPYVPGYLAFREWPLIETCLTSLQTPDVLVCDGQGIAHPRKCGIASHAGILTGLVTVGCGKSRLVGNYHNPGPAKGSKTDLVMNGEKIGEVVRTRDHVKPLFISPGHRIDFSMATSLILSLCSKYRLPEPIRAAHSLVNRIRKEASPQT